MSPTGASWDIAAEEKMNIDPAARAMRANCKDFRIVFLRRFLFARRGIEPRREFMTFPAAQWRRDLPGGAVAAWLLAARASSRRENDARISALAVMLFERG
jgi:hypothetical protein